VRWVGPVAAVLAAAVAGCTPGPPEPIAGDPAPVTVAPTGSVTSAPTRPPGSPTPAGVPQLPTGYQGFELTVHGVTAWLPVPSGWSPPKRYSRSSGAQGVPPAVVTDFDDPTGAQRLRVEIMARQAPTAQKGFEAYEPMLAGDLDDYERLGRVEVVPGVGESAVDVRFTFTSGEDRRLQQAVDRMIVLGSAGVAVYYRTLQRDFKRLEPIWRHAVDRLVLEPD
jgi:hypothetical protein